MKNNPAETNDALAVLERIRPETEPLDVEWSKSVLAQITAEERGAGQTGNPQRHRPRSRARWGLTAAAASGAVVMGAGLAVAGGVVPTFVSESFGKLEETSPHFLDISAIRPLTDIPLPDGTHFTVWRGLNSDGSMCQAELLDTGNSDADDVTTWCYVDESAGRIDDVSVAPIWAPETSAEGSQPKYFVSFGESPSDTARTVRISGHDTDVVLDIDPISGGFGGELTGLEMTPDGDKFTLAYSFRDAADVEVAVRTHGWG